MIRITLHSLLNDDTPRYPRGGIIAVLGPKIGGRIELDISGGVQHTEAVADACLAKIEATEQACIEIGENVIATPEDSEVWGADQFEVRFIPAGGRISAILPA